MSVQLGLGTRGAYSDQKGPNKFKNRGGKKKGKHGKTGHEKIAHKGGWPSVPIVGTFNMGGQ